MTTRIQSHRLQVAANLYHFVEQEALPGTGVDAAAFWQGFDALVHTLAPKNRALLAELRPRFVLVQDLQALQQLGERGVVVFLDGRGLSQSQNADLIDYAELRADAPPPAHAPQPSDSAFVFHADTLHSEPLAQIRPAARRHRDVQHLGADDLPHAGEDRPPTSHRKRAEPRGPALPVRSA